jgi:pilus assembly protein Flp/PilA
MIQGKTMLNALNNFWCEEEGATAVEYGIMVAAIAAVIITIVISIGSKTNTAFGVVDGGLTTAAN